MNYNSDKLGFTPDVTDQNIPHSALGRAGVRPSGSMHRDAPAVKARESRCSHRASLKRYALKSQRVHGPPLSDFAKGGQNEFLSAYNMKSSAGTSSGSGSGNYSHAET